MKTLRELIEGVYGAEQQAALGSAAGSKGALSETGEPLRGMGLVKGAGFDVDDSAWGLILARISSIAHAVAHTCLRNSRQMEQATAAIAGWMRDKAVVRILGAGRALLAGSMPGNRLAHGGAQVSFMGGMVPLPNSERGGGIVACSASGKTVPVLEAMQIARRHNEKIHIIGLASHDAADFAGLCDTFIGIHTSKSEYPNPLSALADTEEYVISEIFDGLVVMAGRALSFDDNAWRRGHEDIGPTGPYAPRDKEIAEKLSTDSHR